MQWVSRSRTTQVAAFFKRRGPVMHYLADVGYRPFVFVSTRHIGRHVLWILKIHSLVLMDGISSKPAVANLPLMLQ
jgi:hypothetical protein